MATFLADATKTAVVQVDLYTFILADGTALRWSGGNSAVTIPSAGFPSGSVNAGADWTFSLGPQFGRSKITTKIGVEPTELDIDIFADNSQHVGNYTVAEAAQFGLFDGASVELDRFFAPPQANGSGALDTSLGVLVWFYGRIADIDAGRSKVSIKVKSLLNLLAIQQMPRRLYQAGCGHVFGDAMCGYDRSGGHNAAGAATGFGAVSLTAASGSDQGHIVASFSPSPADVYNQGTIIATSGANNGASRTISNVSGGAVFVVRPWLSTVTAGDTFTVLPGCDHTTARCNGQFNNLLRYGGFPYIPPPENSI